MGFRGGGRRQRPPKPTRQQLAAQERATDLIHGHGRRRISDQGATFDPPQLGAGEIDRGLVCEDPALPGHGTCRSGRFTDLVAEWALVEGQWLWAVLQADGALESGWAGNRSLARQRAITALGRHVLARQDAGHA